MKGFNGDGLSKREYIAIEIYKSLVIAKWNPHSDKPRLSYTAVILADKLIEELNQS